MGIAKDDAIKQFESLMEEGQCLDPIKFAKFSFFSPFHCFETELLKF